MILADASVLVAAMRDRTGAHARRLLDFAGDDEIVICRFTEMELLAGARDATAALRKSPWTKARPSSTMIATSTPLRL